MQRNGILCGMAEPKKDEDVGTWIFRDIPRPLMRRAKAAAAMQGKPVRRLVIELMRVHLAELERKGILTKEK